jgi:hypothetical protein
VSQAPLGRRNSASPWVKGCSAAQRDAEGLESRFRDMVVVLSAGGLVDGRTTRPDQRLEGVWDHLRPEGADAVSVDPDVSQDRANVMFDAQTSGGLLIALPPDRADQFLSALHQRDVADAALIGEVADGSPGQIQVLP